MGRRRYTGEVSSLLRNALLVSLVGSGCLPLFDRCDVDPCPQTTGYTKLLSGSVTLDVGGSPQERTVGESSQPPEGYCAVNGLVHYVHPDESVSGPGVKLSCNLGHGMLTVTVPELNDPRSLPAGTHPVPTVIELDECDDAGCQSCPPGPSTAMLTVSDAKGGAAPYPQAVTADMKRTFTIDFTMSAGSAADPRCTRAVSLQATMSFQTIAADWRYDPNGPCVCE